jgi:uncharacterized repeat protein (TIGR03803 family)
MKSLIKLITLATTYLLILFSNYLNAQTLYGLTSVGGDSAGGVLFRYDVASKHDSLISQFPNTPSYPLYTNLIQASDGNLYGMASKTGSQNLGAIFKCTTSGAFKIIVSFTGANGSYPQGSLIQASDGNLYGMTTNGGDSNKGTIFKCTTTGLLTTLVSFIGTNGANPAGSLVQATDGNLYGMTYAGGSSNTGTLFKCSTSGTLTTLINFSGASGSYPYGSLIQASNGNLYGMTSGGGTSTYGTMFKCSTGGILTTLVNFTGPYTSGGDFPLGTLLQASDGNFYGTTDAGGASNDGILFQYDTTTKTLNVLVAFNGTNGQSPYGGSLIQATDGNLYGMTKFGGSSYKGTLFKCTTSGTLTTLVNFTGANGTEPWGSLIQASDGNLYGLVWTNSTSPGYGTLFRCTTSGTLTTLVNFGVTAIGNTPDGSLMKATDGNFYGTTVYGGSAGEGTIFKYNPVSNTTTTLINFTGTNGENPYCDLMQASDGNLYGITSAGGSSSCGTIFKLTLSGTFTTLINFSGSNGKNAQGSLVQASDGNLYGMTPFGGTASYGNLFKCTTSGTLTNIVNFSNAETPYSNMIVASDGNLYGTTVNVRSCSSVGSLFKLTVSSETFTTLVNFDTTKASNPIGKPVQATDGNLYGTAYNGGSLCFGAIYKYSISSGTFTLLADFNDTNGANPRSGLMQASDGNLYGMTDEGGAFNMGTLYKCTTVGVITKLLDFDNKNGAYPEFGNLLELDSPTAINQIKVNNFFVSQNEPNPFNATTKITYSLTQSADVGFNVCDVMGKKLLTMTYGNRTIGENTIILNANQFSPGIYFYTLIVNGQSVTKKMIITGGNH